jgi:hypothetical protein
VNHRSLFTSVHYRGLVRSAKRAYHVFEGPQHFVLLSPGRDGTGGNYHVIQRRALEYVLSRVGGSRSITAKQVLDICRRSKFITTRFDVLNTLYALAGIKKARIAGMKGQTLVFAVSKGIAQRPRARRRR